MKEELKKLITFKKNTKNFSNNEVLKRKPVISCIMEQEKTKKKGRTAMAIRFAIFDFKIDKLFVISSICHNDYKER